MACLSSPFSFLPTAPHRPSASPPPPHVHKPIPMTMTTADFHSQSRSLISISISFGSCLTPIQCWEPLNSKSTSNRAACSMELLIYLLHTQTAPGPLPSTHLSPHAPCTPIMLPSLSSSLLLWQLEKIFATKDKRNVTVTNR